MMEMTLFIIGIVLVINTCIIASRLGIIMDSQTHNTLKILVQLDEIRKQHDGIRKL